MQKLLTFLMIFENKILTKNIVDIKTLLWLIEYFKII